MSLRLEILSNLRKHFNLIPVIWIKFSTLLFKTWLGFHIHCTFINSNETNCYSISILCYGGLPSTGSKILKLKFIMRQLTFVEYERGENEYKVQLNDTIPCRDNRFFFLLSSVRIWQCEISVFGVGVCGKIIIFILISRKIVKKNCTSWSTKNP